MRYLFWQFVHLLFEYPAGWLQDISNWAYAKANMALASTRNTGVGKP